MEAPRPILFFDGVCGLCNHFVDFVLTRDKKQVFLFSPLQGDLAQKTLPFPVTDLTTVVLKEGEKIFVRSSAVIRVLSLLGGGWKVATLFRVAPVSLLDWFYAIVSRNRYRIFGKREACRLPTAEERAHFI